MQLTKFGKIIRKLRVEYNLLLGSMAKSLGISSSYLSSIEMGERDIPEHFFEKIKSLNIFNNRELEDVQTSIYETKKVFNFRPKNNEQQNLIAGFARSFDNLSVEQIKAIRVIVENNSQNKG
jgi:transcriptional regulator with XRE-family HTH domain